jgi:hypothetical protein
MKSLLARIAYITGGALLLTTTAAAVTGQVRFAETAEFGRAVAICPLSLIASQRVSATNGDQLAGPGIRSVGQVADLMIDGAMAHGMEELRDNPFQGLGLAILANMKPAIRSAAESTFRTACNR